MAIAKLLQVSDLHDKGDCREIDGLAQLVNETKPDSILAAGDIFDGIVYHKLFLEANEKIDSIINLTDEEKVISKIQPMYEQLRNMSEDEIKQKIQNLDKPEKEKKQIIENVQTYLENKEEINQIMDNLDSKIKNNQEKIAEINQEVINTIAQNMKKSDEELSKIKPKIIATRGDHETDIAYLVKNIHWLEKDGPVSVKGLTIAGAPNTYEQIKGIPEELYNKLEEDEPIKDIEEFIKQYGTKDDLEKFKENNQTYQRLENQLKDKKADILVTHKGIDSFAGKWGYGAGLALWVKEKTIDGKKPIILCGHEHSNPFYSNEHGYEGLRSNPERAYVLYVDTETKKIKEIDVYKKVIETKH